MKTTRPGFLLMVVFSEAVLLSVVCSCKESTSPARSSTRVAFAAVSAGLYYTCGVTTGGAAYCWGQNRYGQLGNGTIDYDSHEGPVPVSGGLSFGAVSPGETHICGLTIGGAADCWGDNTYGQLGNGSTAWTLTPVAVSGGLTFAAVSAGYLHTCGLTTGGAAYCWGFNAEGELGAGPLVSNTGPQKCSLASCSMTPVAVSGGLTFAAVSSGRTQTCGLTTGGTAYCWGGNGSGESGNGSSSGSAIPLPVLNQ